VTKYQARIRYYVGGSAMNFLINVEEGDNEAEARTFLEDVIAENAGWELLGVFANDKN